MYQSSVVYHCKKADFSAVFAHLTKCNSNFVPKLDEKVDITAYSKKIAENSVTFEAWVNEELVGLIAAYFNDPAKATGFITNVSTVSEFFGMGIASQLMKNCIDYGSLHQFKAIGLEVFNQNTGAVQLYKKYGFYQTGIKDDYLQMKKDL